MTGACRVVLAAQGQRVRDCGGASPHTGTLWRPSVSCEDTFHIQELWSPGGTECLSGRITGAQIRDAK